MARPGPYQAVAKAAPKAAAAKAVAKAAPKAAAAKAVAKAAPAPALAPSPAPSIKIFSELCNDNWMDDLVRHVGKANEMVLCSFAYDDRNLQNALLPRVKDRQLKLKVIVDGRYLYGPNAPYYSMIRLQNLQEAGAEVRVGGTAASNMHYKIALLSGPNSFTMCYHGGSNATQASRQSWECVTRYMDSNVVAQFKRIADHCWDFGRSLRNQ
jgi:hypothetical protein